MKVINNWSLLFSRDVVSIEEGLSIQGSMAKFIAIGLPIEEKDLISDVRITGKVNTGQQIVTSRVIKWAIKDDKSVISKKNDSWVITTKSGSHYELPLESIDPGQKKLFEMLAWSV